VNSKIPINNVAGIIIAAGESKRLGTPKQLLPWQGKMLLEYIIQTISNCNIDPIHVILGSNYEQITSVINFQGVKIINNKNWKEGKGTSISLGIRSLPEQIKAAFIFVGDQPFLNANLIGALLHLYKNKEFDIVAPFVHGIQSNPVLFNQSVFKELIKLKGEEGGKDIFKKFRLEKLDWDKEQILWDIDSLEDYQKLINLV
jgi:molybdenum cofactor cytidylyltransferase